MSTRSSFWTPAWRALVFFLAATSIFCLLAEFYGLCSMRTFTFFISLPALLVLALLAILDRRRGDGRLVQAVVIGSIGGLLAACAYDLFRLPFVFAREWHLDGILPALPLYKVFPLFGAMILNEPLYQQHFSPAVHAVGWLYHFSNGATFGIMYLALAGDPRRHWLWAVLLAVGIEIAMLLTPYTSYFDIKIGAAFVLVTLTAHLIFGATLGVAARRFSVAPATSSL